MKSSSIKNLFEYRDTKTKRALKNIIASVGKFQGVGLPDLCYITKRIPKGFFKSGFDEESSFHFVQGLCPSCELKVQQYMLSIKESNTLIESIVYTIYDLFSKTLIMCTIECLSNGHQFQQQAVNEKLQFTQITGLHWQGAYVSGVLRAINQNLEVPITCKFFNEININNQLIQQLFELSQGYFQLNNTQTEFPSLDNLIYYLNWPIFILYRHLLQTNQLDLLMDAMQTLQENTAVIYIKAIIYYKKKQIQIISRNYRQSLNKLLQLNKSNMTKYLLAKVYIKLKKYDCGFLLLKDILADTLDHWIIWITLVLHLIIQASIFRKKQLPEICFSLLNKAAELTTQSISQFEKLLNLQNFQIFCECKQLKNVKSLNKIYTIINPQNVEQIECFVQLSGHPNLDQLWMKNCASYKSSKYVIKKSQQSFLVNNELANNELSIFLKETLKLTNTLDISQIPKQQKYLQKIDPSKGPSDQDFKIKIKDYLELKWPKNKKLRSELFKIIISEKSLESFESEIGKEKDEPEPDAQSKIINGLEFYLNDNLTNSQRQEFKFYNMNNQFSQILDNIIKVRQEIEVLFFSTGLESNAIQDTPSQTEKSRSKITIQDFYSFESTRSLENNIKIKTEAGFLYKCAIIAKNLHMINLSMNLLQKMSSKMISVQVYAQMFQLIQHEDLLKLYIQIYSRLQKALQSFVECGIKKYNTIPLWIEKSLIQLMVTLGGNKLRQEISSLTPDFTQELLMKYFIKLNK